MKRDHQETVEAVVKMTFVPRRVNMVKLEKKWLRWRQEGEREAQEKGGRAIGKPGKKLVEPNGSSAVQRAPVLRKSRSAYEANISDEDPSGDEASMEDEDETPIDSDVAFHFCCLCISDITADNEDSAVRYREPYLTRHTVTYHTDYKRASRHYENGDGRDETTLGRCLLCLEAGR